MKRLPQPHRRGSGGQALDLLLCLSCGEVVLAPPSYSPPLPTPSRPHPLPGSGRSEHLETGWLTDALPSTSASKPTTHSCSRADESSCSNHEAMAQKAKQKHRQQIGYPSTCNFSGCPVLSCDAGTQTASVWACTLTGCPYTHVWRGIGHKDMPCHLKTLITASYAASSPSFNPFLATPGGRSFSFSPLY